MPPPDPDPVSPPTTCKIKPLTVGPREGSYPQWNWKTSPLPGNQRHGEFTGYTNNVFFWRFFYEAMVIISGPFNPSEWETGFKRESWLKGGYKYRGIDGSLIDVAVNQYDPDDLKDSRQQAWTGNISYWLDAPGKSNIDARSGNPIVEGDLTFTFRFSAKNSRTGATCSASLVLKLHIDTPAGPGPPFPPAKGHWTVQ